MTEKKVPYQVNGRQLEKLWESTPFPLELQAHADLIKPTR